MPAGNGNAAPALNILKPKNTVNRHQGRAYEVDAYEARSEVCRETAETVKKSECCQTAIKLGNNNWCGTQTQSYYIETSQNPANFDSK